MARGKKKKSEEKAPAEKKHKFSLIEMVETIAFAIIVAALIKQFILQVYIIPTGSMAPTLYGLHKNVTCQRSGYPFARGTKEDYSSQEALCPFCRKENDIAAVRNTKGDRILATNFIYMLKEPRRWDPVIFKYPKGPRKDFIKRLIAFEGEEVQIINGDIYINGDIAAKPLDVQESIWMQVYDSNYPRNDGMKYWRPVTGTWSETKGSLKVNNLSKKGLAEVVFGHTQVYDIYGYNHNSGSPVTGEYNVVGDLQVSSEISFEGETGVIYGRLRESCAGQSDFLENTFSFEINIQPQETTLAILKNEEEKLKKTLSVPLEPGHKYRVDFMNYDDTIILKIGGQVALRFYEPAEMNNKYVKTAGSEVALGAKELIVSFGNLKIFRDIYYTRGGGFFESRGEKVIVEDRNYWVMGDNSPESSDSRTWGFVPENALEGRALLVWWPPWRVGIVR